LIFELSWFHTSQPVTKKFTTARAAQTFIHFGISVIYLELYFS